MEENKSDRQDLLENLDVEVQRLRRATHRRFAPISARAEACWDGEESSPSSSAGALQAGAVEEDDDGDLLLIVSDADPGAVEE